MAAPRASWRGNLRLSLVTCPIELFPATSEKDKVSFNQINRKTGNRIRYKKVDASTGDEGAHDVHELRSAVAALRRAFIIQPMLKSAS
jgi:non-homologous end joining protein Ku